MKKAMAFGLVLTLVWTLLLVPAFGLTASKISMQSDSQNLLQDELPANPSTGANEIASAVVVLGCMTAAALMAFVKQKKSKPKKDSTQTIQK